MFFFLFCKTRYLIKEVSGTEPSLSVRVPWIDNYRVKHSVGVHVGQSPDLGQNRIRKPKSRVIELLHLVTDAPTQLVRKGNTN